MPAIVDNHRSVPHAMNLLPPVRGRRRDRALTTIWRGWLHGLGLCALLGAPLLARADAVDAPVAEDLPAAPPAGLVFGPGVHLAGYGTLQLLVPQSGGAGAAAGSASSDPQFSDRSRLNLSHLSAILWWEPSATWKLLGEVDAEDAAQLPSHVDSQDGAASAAFVSLERLYADYRASDALTLRVGKFLTPIGRWNQEHSDPLTWTTLRPLISDSAFPTNATGAMGFGSLPVGNRWVDYQLWASQGSGWRASPREDPFRRALGLRLATALTPALQVGASLSDFVQRDDSTDSFRLAGIDLVWSSHGTELSTEAIVRRSATGQPGATEHGGFVQAVFPLALRWFAVTRVETYKRADDALSSRSALLGLVYRSGRHWVAKAEWVRSNASAEGLPQGLLTSVTLLF